MDSRIKRFILGIVSSQYDLTLATIRPDGYPQANTVSYANDGFVLYFGTMRDSQKVKNLQHCNKVSLTIVASYSDWADIRALSMGGTAHVLLDDAAEGRHAAELVTKRYPAVLDTPPPGDPSKIVFIRITPRVVSVLDYRKGFGHTQLVNVAPTDFGP